MHKLKAYSSLGERAIGRRVLSVERAHVGVRVSNGGVPFCVGLEYNEQQLI